MLVYAASKCSQRFSSLVLMGDRKQLASIEPGALFGGMLRAADALSAFGVVRFQQNHRIAGASDELRRLLEFNRAVRIGDADEAMTRLRRFQRAVDVPYADSGAMPACFNVEYTAVDGDPTQAACLSALLVVHRMRRAAESAECFAQRVQCLSFTRAATRRMNSMLTSYFYGLYIDDARRRVAPLPDFSTRIVAGACYVSQKLRFSKTFLELGISTNQVFFLAAIEDVDALNVVVARPDHTRMPRRDKTQRIYVLHPVLRGVANAAAALRVEETSALVAASSPANCVTNFCFQGSESHSIVYLVLPPRYSIDYYCESVETAYTAASRASHCLCIVGAAALIRQILDKTTPPSRRRTNALDVLADSPVLRAPTYDVKKLRTQ
jgi:hypothetical protein